MLVDRADFGLVLTNHGDDILTAIADVKRCRRHANAFAFCRGEHSVMTVPERNAAGTLLENSTIEAVKRRASNLVLEGGRWIRRRWNYGTPIWDCEWDLLIVLDACRWDLFCEVAPEYDFLPADLESKWTYSPASMSEEWLEVHAADQYCEEMSRTAMISGNINTCWKEWFRTEWGYLEEVWRYGWVDKDGTVPARAVTDATIDYVRDQRTKAKAERSDTSKETDPVDGSDVDRTIAWYFQPHRPFVPVEWSGGFEFDRLTDRDRDIRQVNEFKQYRDGKLSREQLWEGYAANLRYVLDEVDVLLQNVDADQAVITSDHANLLGECGVYEHPRDFPHPALRRVPWVPVAASDERTRTSTDEFEAAGDHDGPSDAEIRDRLRHLGYVD